jgi:hypothetical protein
MGERLVGAAEHGIHSAPVQLPLGRPARRGAFKDPDLDAPAGRRAALEQGLQVVESPGDSLVQEDRHEMGFGEVALEAL